MRARQGCGEGVVRVFGAGARHASCLVEGYKVVEGVGDGASVHHLLVVDAGEWAAHEVAHVVESRLKGCEGL